MKYYCIGLSSITDVWEQLLAINRRTELNNLIPAKTAALLYTLVEYGLYPRLNNTNTVIQD
jgi:hypothetical protein